jgi:hypothetical protein
MNIDTIASMFDADQNGGIDRLLPDLSFADYQKLPAINASLLKNTTSYEMLCYYAGMNSLDALTRAYAERNGAGASEVLDYLEGITPRKVAARWVRQRPDVEIPKLTEAQKAVWEQVGQQGADSREFPPATIKALDSKGLLEFEDVEVEEAQLSPHVKESRAYALAVGDATHKAILEPHTFENGEWQKHWQISPTKGLTSKQALEAAANDPRALITPEIVDVARRCRDAVYRHGLARELLERPRKNECSAVAWSPESDCWQKARFDSLPDDPSYGILDVKTTHSGLLKGQLRKSMWRFSYHLQAAFYLDVLAQIEGFRRNQFHMIFVTKEQPFICRCVELCSAPEDKSFVTQGRELYTERRAMWAVAWLQKTWDAYENDSLTTLATDEAR